MKLDVREGFIWGTATAAHQVEGGNTNNDWWAWEHDPEAPCTEPSGDACDHYHLYPQDIAAIAEHGLGAYRFSIEWSRIEPAEGEFSRSQLRHYRRMCETCLEHGIQPCVTFHHFTSPSWFSRAGGWVDDGAPERFARFCSVAAEELGDLLALACTINEPNIVSFFGYRVGVFPPGVRERDERLRANDVFIAAHGKAVEAIKEHTDAPVGMTLAMAEYQAVDSAEEQMLEMRTPMEDAFLEAARGDDFIGVQTYSRVRIGPNGQLPAENPEATQMGYDFYPQALEHTIRRAASVTGCPVVVTENGIATQDDTRRIDYVTEALRGLQRCVDEGVDVRGYFYWSWLDNFEWVLGYGPTFGLTAVDRATQERTHKPSARWFGEIARTGVVPD